MVLVTSALVFVTVCPAVTQTHIQDVLHQLQVAFVSSLLIIIHSQVYVLR